MKTTETNITNNYPQFSAAFINDIRKRLADVPKDVLERVHHAFIHEPIQVPGSILYKAGVCLSSHELYEYRKALFPPNALVDPDTQGPPILRNPPEVGRGVPAEPLADGCADTVAASGETSPTKENEQLHQARQRLVQLLSARAQQTTDIASDSSSPASSNAVEHNGPLTTDNRQPDPQGQPSEISNLKSEIPVPPTIDRADLSAASELPSTRRRNGLGLEDVEPWPDPVDGAALLDDLRQVLRRYVVLPGMAPETLALWVVHTYAFELRNVSTYIGLGSPQKRCGKTTLLTVLTELVSRPVVASNISPPALFRAIEEARPTLLIDEADTFLQANDEMRGILNSGYTRKTAFVVRVANEAPSRATHRSADSLSASTPPTGNAPSQISNLKSEIPLPGSSHPFIHSSNNPNPDSRLVRFSCWCPKVIAAIGRLPDTLLDRCIPITMQRKSPEETCERLRHLDGHALRRKCARFVVDHAREIAAARPQIPAQLNDRAADIWEPLLVIADLAGANWPELARDAALQMSAGMPDSTIIGSLLIDILATFIEEDIERISSRALVDSLNAFRDRPWAEARKHKEIDGLWLSQQLRPYGVRPKAMWLDGKTVKGYAKSDFEQVWPRYVSRSDFDALLADRGVQSEIPRNADCQSAVSQVANLPDALDHTPTIDQHQ